MVVVVVLIVGVVTLALNHLKSTSIFLVICGTFAMSYHFSLQYPLVDFANWSFGFRKGSGGTGWGVGGGGNDDSLARTCMLLGIYSTKIVAVAAELALIFVVNDDKTEHMKDRHTDGKNNSTYAAAAEAQHVHWHDGG